MDEFGTQISPSGNWSNTTLNQSAVLCSHIAGEYVFCEARVSNSEGFGLHNSSDTIQVQCASKLCTAFALWQAVMIFSLNVDNFYMDWWLILWIKLMLDGYLWCSIIIYFDRTFSSSQFTWWWRAYGEWYRPSESVNFLACEYMYDLTYEEFIKCLDDLPLLAHCVVTLLSGY